MNKPLYPGIDQDVQGGLTHLGRIVMDAWVFGILPETQRCAGWDYGRMQDLYEKVNAKWDEFGPIPSQLPEPYRSRHERIYAEAVERARTSGWDPELSDDD